MGVIAELALADGNLCTHDLWPESCLGKDAALPEALGLRGVRGRYHQRRSGVCSEGQRGENRLLQPQLCAAERLR